MVPLVLGAVLLALVLLSRCAVMPLLLIASVALSFVATLGAFGLISSWLALPTADASFPLSVFVFLVAFATDHNVLLVARALERVPVHGHRAAMTALAATGPATLLAGMVPAVAFVVLALPSLVSLGDLAFTVAFGTLLDAVVVRAVLVPALAVDLGAVVWWPGWLWRSRGTRASPTWQGPS